MDQTYANEEENMEPSKEKKGRGPTKLPHITKLRSSGKKLEIKVNSKGQPVGKNLKVMASFIGVLARSMVPITHESWIKVPKALKEKIWDCIKIAFDVDGTFKKKLLQSTGSKWKGFKCYLNRKFIRASKDNPHKLQEPLVIYKFLSKFDWESCVKSRSSEAFSVYSQLQKERQSHNQYPSRLSRLGYANLEEELQEEYGSNEEISRHILWMLGRQNKEGKHEGDELLSRVKVIKELSEEVKNGNITIEGSNDILGKALPTPQHPGRVTGAGQFVTPTTFFDIPKRRGRGKELDMMKMMSQEPTTPQSEHDSCDIYLNGKFCKLALGSRDNIVAQGMIVTTKDLNPTIHGLPLGENIRVAIDIAVKGYALLPIPVADELITVSDAIGSHVAWPRELVIVSVDDVESSKQFKKNDKISEEVMTQPQLQWSRKTPMSLKFIISYGEKCMTGSDCIQVQLEKDILGHEFTANIEKDDLVQFSGMAEISVTSVTLYLRPLYNLMRESNLTDKFAFVDPNLIAQFAGTLDERARVIADRLENAKPNQIFFLPFNQSFHWMLVILDPDNNIAYFLDPIREEVRRDIKDIVNEALKMFATQKQRMLRKSIAWKSVMCPKQPTNKECGYYVLKYMRDIIADPHISVMQKFQGMNTYTQEEIDGMRSEWAEFVASEI